MRETPNKTPDMDGVSTDHKTPNMTPSMKKTRTHSMNSVDVVAQTPDMDSVSIAHKTPR